MASLITPQFEQYIAQQTVANGTVVFDEFIFANIPGLNETNLANYLRIPTAAQIVHRQAVSQAGVINENAVVYSVTIGTEIGNFDFNFIGLINKSKNLLAVAVQTSPVKKIRNQNNVQGNSITRNILLEFSGAKALTGINVAANTWQIDFTARLHGLDEKICLTNRDLYGRAVFFDDGFLVKRKTGNQFTIQPGQAYVEGVRMNLNALRNITAATLPCSIYADVVHHCTVTGAYETQVNYITQAKADYVDTANRQHYVQILADIDRNGSVTDRRLLSPFLGITPLALDDTTTNHCDHRGHTHSLPIASLIKKGIVKLFSGVNSNEEDMAATPKAVKTAYDKAVDVESKAVLITGDQDIRGYKSFTSTLESKYRMLVRRNDDNHPPYFWLINQSVDMTSDAVKAKLLNEIAFRAGEGDGVAKAVIKTFLLADKNASIEIGGNDANNRYRYFIKTFSKTNNVVIGKAADNERDLLQVAGTIAAGTPPANAANDQVVTVGWAKSYGVSKAGDTINGQLTISNTNWGKLNFPNAAGGVWRQEFNPASETDPRFNIIYTKADKSSLYCSFPRLEKSETVAYRSWVDNQKVAKSGDTMTGNLVAPDVKTSTGKALSLAHQSTDEYVNVTGSTTYGGLTITKPDGKKMRYERAGNKFKLWAEGLYAIYTPERDGTLALNDDFVGSVAFFARATPPTGWLKANGAAVSRTTYAALFAAIGTTFGAGDGRTTFNLPDLRGEFLRGLDDGRNVDRNRGLGSWQKGTIIGFDGLDCSSSFGVGLVRDGAYNTLTVENSPPLVGADDTTYDDVRETALKWTGAGGARATNNAADREGGFWTKNNKNIIGGSHFAGMARPRNIALLACIKY